MKKILLLSDTHSYMDERILEYAKNADEIWHCGDFGSLEVIEALEKIKPVRGVYGNIDNEKIRKIFPEVVRFKCEEAEVLMIHIGGYPGKYSPLAKKEIAENPIHSSVLKFLKVILQDEDVILMYGAKNEKYNQAVVLKEWLEKNN